MLNYKEMTDEQLIPIVLEHRKRLDALKRTIYETMGWRSDKKTAINVQIIKEEYAALKNEIKEIAHYCGLQRNYTGKASLYSAFKSNYKEAYAWGFGSPINSNVNDDLYRSVEEAHYKLGKHYQWDKLLK